MEENTSKFPEWLLSTGRYSSKKIKSHCIQIKNGKRKVVKEPVIRFGNQELEAKYGR